MLGGKFLNLQNILLKKIPSNRIFTDELKTFTYGTDASFYRLTPQMVVKTENEDEILFLLKEAKRLKVPVTFRAAGTSLSGQSITDSVLILLGDGWRTISISDNASSVTVRPGAIGGTVNQRLAKYNKKIGPDPASINTAMMGGIIANNASGMSSGVKYNSYNTVESMRIIFEDGTLLDTGDEKSREEFVLKKKELVEQLLELKKELAGDEASMKKIEKKYGIKNVTGYGLNSLSEFEDPVDIIQHLMIGSEGTLGFISEITLKTVDDPQKRATSLMLFPDIETACRAIVPLRGCKVAAAELMDRASLKSIENKEGIPSYIKDLNSSATALLVDTRAGSEDELLLQTEEIKKSLTAFEMIRPIEFTTDLSEINALWNVRKGLFPSVCAERQKGTTVIIEDITVPVNMLDKALSDLHFLFEEYEYNDAIIWGHAFDGNVHFVLIQDFSDRKEIQRYEEFINELVDLVVIRYDGSLKGEHGTGRNMAPFVKMEWGDHIYSIMKSIKQLFDPEGLLNPGVLINEDHSVHLKNLKPMPQANNIIDDCIECGFCEPGCVSKELTLSPRQRIVAYREITSLSRTGKEEHRLALLKKQFSYNGEQTCAADGLCETRCPVSINTGNLIKELRLQNRSGFFVTLAGLIGNNMGLVTRAGRSMLNLVYALRKILGKDFLVKASVGLRELTKLKLPVYPGSMPKGSGPIEVKSNNVAQGKNRVVYFPTCINRTMGVSSDYDEQTDLVHKTESLLKKAGYEVVYPDNLENLCCGMSFLSKGYIEIGMKKSNELQNELLKASNNGEWPVLCDMSPCLYTMKQNMEGSGLTLYEPIEFILKFLKDKLEFKRTEEPVTVFTVCSSRKMGLENKMTELASLCSRNVITPELDHCCGFAGDRGFTYPELNKTGLRHLPEQIPAGCNEGYATSRTCEIGLTENIGISYKSIIYLVDKVTFPKMPDK